MKETTPRQVRSLRRERRSLVARLTRLHEDERFRADAFFVGSEAAERNGRTIHRTRREVLARLEAVEAALERAGVEL